MKLKKVLAAALSAAMVVTSVVMPQGVTKAAGTGKTYADLGTYDTSETTDAIPVTEKGVKVSFTATIAANQASAWFTPQFQVLEGESVKFTGRTDNYAFDAAGNRWADPNPLANSNAYVFSGSFDNLTGQSEEVTSNYTLEAYLVGKSMIVSFGNESFTSTSRVAVESTENCSVKLAADHCKISNISVTDGSRYTESLENITSPSYQASRSKKIEVTDKGVILSFVSKSTGAGNYNGPVVEPYSGDSLGPIIRTDVCLNHDGAEGSDNQNGTLNGISAAMATSFGGDWAAWNTRKQVGTGCLTYAYLKDGKLVIEVANNTFGSTTTYNVDTSKSVYIDLSGDGNEMSEIVVSYPDIAVESLDIVDKTKTLLKGETCDLQTTYAPAAAREPNVTWSSDSESVATVDKNGRVTAIGAGTATITATTDNGKSASCVITVKAEDIHATKVTPTTDKTDLLLKETANISYTYEPENVTGIPEKEKAVTYTSSDENVLTVDKDGKVTAVGNGTAKITVTFDGQSGEVAFTVDGDPDSEFIAGGWWSDWTKGYKLEDDSIHYFNFKVRSYGKETWNNVAAVFVNCLTDGTKEPKAENFTGYAEYGVIRGDNYGWGSVVGDKAANVTWEMGDNNADLVEIMKDAEVNVGIQRDGDKIIYSMSAINGDKIYKRVATFTHTKELPTYVFFVCDTSVVKVTEGAYLVRTAAKEATCTEAGNIEYWTCDGKKYSDADMSKELTDDEITIPAAHKWVVDEEKTTATCISPGTVTRECSVCHKTEAGESVDKLGHDYGQWNTTKEATCTETGTRIRTCTRHSCTDETKGHTETETIPAKGHTLERVAAKKATCTEAGNTEYYNCKVCDKKFSDAEGKAEITDLTTIMTAALDHTYNAGEITKAPTCTEPGVLTKTCTREGCTAGTTGHTKTETIPAKGHSLTKVEAKEATVSAEGNKEYYTCPACKKYFADKDGTMEITLASTVIPKKSGTLKGDTTVTLTLNMGNVTLYTGKAANSAVIKAKVTGTSDAVIWNTSNANVAKVEKGTIKATGKGTATITATVKGISKTIQVTVKNPSIKVKKGKKTVSKVSVKRKKTVKLKVSVSPSKSGMSLAKLSKKDKKKIKATLKNGKLTIKGKKKGKVTLKIKSGKAVKKIKVTVK